MYSLLAVDPRLQTRGESFYNSYLPEIVSALEEKGLLKESDGARCVFLDGYTNRDGEPLPVIVQKSDGGYMYSTTDLAAMRHRAEVEGANRILYVTDAGQALHFEQVRARVRAESTSCARLKLVSPGEIVISLAATSIDILLALCTGILDRQTFWPCPPGCLSRARALRPCARRGWQEVQDALR